MEGRQAVLAGAEWCTGKGNRCLARIKAETEKEEDWG